jgi:molybdenum-dependent DNA-binding transcriptional regulator ModE
MNQVQFDALSKLMSMRAGPAREAVRLHLVDGVSVPDAARQAGCGYRSAWQAVQRAQAALELARTAADA